MSVVTFDRTGQSGNIFYIMGMAIKAMKLEGRMNDAEQMTVRVTHSGSYEEALEIIAEYVDLVEVEQ